jgi:hypothetical protein
VILYDFRCKNGHITEELVKADTPSIRCECGEEATRTITPVRFTLDGTDPGYPTAHERWVREHERAGKH